MSDECDSLGSFEIKFDSLKNSLSFGNDYASNEIIAR